MYSVQTQTSLPLKRTGDDSYSRELRGSRQCKSNAKLPNTIWDVNSVPTLQFLAGIPRNTHSIRLSSPIRKHRLSLTGNSKTLKIRSNALWDNSPHRSSVHPANLSPNLHSSGLLSCISGLQVAQQSSPI